MAAAPAHPFAAPAIWTAEVTWRLVCFEVVEYKHGILISVDSAQWLLHIVFSQRNSTDEKNCKNIFNLY